MNQQSKIQQDIINLIEKKLEENSALIGINIGALDGSLITGLHKKEHKLTNLEIASANSSILFLSSKMLRSSLNQSISHNLIAGKDSYLFSIITNNISMISYLDRELTELEGLFTYVRMLKDFALKISAIIETSELIKEEIFISIKRAIPNTLIIAILTKDGLPIQVQSTMPEPMLSAMISAIYHLSEVLMETKDVEYSIITGENGSIIVHELDENRILAIAVPEADESKIGTYIAKIKAFIK
ncbi:MAG: hypothetical protein ACFFAH_04785 [Promethearchaeota archaeon]